MTKTQTATLETVRKLSEMDNQAKQAMGLVADAGTLLRSIAQVTATYNSDFACDGVGDSYAAVGRAVEAMTTSYTATGQLHTTNLQQLQKALRTLRRDAGLSEDPLLADLNAGSDDMTKEAKITSGPEEAKAALELAVAEVFPAVIKLRKDLLNQSFVQDRKGIASEHGSTSQRPAKVLPLMEGHGDTSTSFAENRRVSGESDAVLPFT